MMITKLALPRRTILRGLGATLALPLLDAMVPALTAMAQTPAKGTLRLGIAYMPNGMQLINFIPKTEGAGFEITPILTPLAPFRDQLVVVSGLSNVKAEMLDEGGGAHARPAGTWLNGTRVKRTTGDAEVQAGKTVDQYAADVLGRDTPLRSLELALEPNFVVGNCETGYTCAYINTTSWRTPTTPLPMETNPRVVFERLFGDAATSDARVAQMKRERSLLDSVMEETTGLQRTLGLADRRRVTDYLEAVRDVERRLQVSEQRVATIVDAPPAPLGIPESFREHAELMFDLYFLAYQADITRVVSLQIARELSTRSYPEIGVAESHHDVSHHGNNPDKVEKKTRIDTYHMQFFARLVERMRSTPDGDGSLLDHSILLAGAGMGDGNEHSPHNLPVVLVGGGCGQLQGGRHVKYPLDTPMMNLGLSLLDKVGLELESIGDSTGRLAGI
jgi:hypothetical protein